MRLLIECTYVFEHPKDNSGIQRVVRNVINNLPHIDTTVECIPVVMQNNQLYSIKQLRPMQSQNLKDKLLHFVSVQHSRLERLKQRIWNYRARKECTGIFIRSPSMRAMLTIAAKTATLAIAVPQKILSFFSLRYLDKAGVQKLQCLPGDVLVLLDSSWHSDFFKLTERLKKQGVKIISVVYDLIPLTHPQFCDDGLVRVFDQWFGWVSKTADGFVAISQTIQKQIKQEVEFRLGLEKAQHKWFEHFYLGSDLDQADPNIVVRREVRKMCKMAPVYLMVSTIEPRKNHNYLVDAFDILWADGSEVSLCFVGKIGWKTEQLIQRIRQHPEYQKKFFMFNDLSDRELEYCYSNARSLVFPSYVEGFGLPLVEAMQRGLPAMASDIPVFREIGGNSMAYFDLKKPESLSKLVEKFENTKKFPAQGNPSDWNWISWEKSTQQLIEKIQAKVQQPVAT